MGESSNRQKDKFYKYCVDVLSGWMYYTPVYAFQEFLSGNDLETILKTRAVAMIAHAAVMRPVGISRDYVAKQLGVTKNSSYIEKWRVNLIASTPIQIFTYGLVLLAGMEWSGNYDINAAMHAWSMGIIAGSVHGVIHGAAQDEVRKKFGLEEAINNGNGVKPSE